MKGGFRGVVAYKMFIILRELILFCICEASVAVCSYFLFTETCLMYENPCQMT